MADGARANGCVITLDGALTAATVGVLEGALALHLAVRPAILVLDLSALDGCDATGAAMIRAAVGAGQDCGIAVALAAGPPDVLRALESAGALDSVPVYRTSHGATRCDPYDLLSPKPGHSLPD